MAHNLPDVTTFAANIVVFALAIAAAVGGVFTAVKTMKSKFMEIISSDKPSDGGARLLGGVITENVSMIMLTEQLRTTCDELREVCGCVRENANEVRELRHEMALGRAQRANNR